MNFACGPKDSNLCDIRNSVNYMLCTLKNVQISFLPCSAVEEKEHSQLPFIFILFLLLCDMYATENTLWDHHVLLCEQLLLFAWGRVVVRSG